MKPTIEEILRLYDATESGEIINIFTSRIMKQRINHNGYKEVSLVSGRRQFKYKVHRIIATKYIPNPDKKPFINHIDTIKVNNHYTNLEWVTTEENNLHSHNNGSIEYPLNNNIIEIINMYNAGHKADTIASKFNVSNATISLIINGHTYKHISRTKISYRNIVLH